MSAASMTVAERIYEIMSSDAHEDVRAHLHDQDVIEKAKAKAVDAEDLLYDMMDYAFSAGMAFALTQPEPLEPLWSVSARAYDVLHEVEELKAKHRTEFALRMAKQQGGGS